MAYGAVGLRVPRNNSRADAAGSPQPDDADPPAQGAGRPQFGRQLKRTGRLGSSIKAPSVVLNYLPATLQHFFAAATAVTTSCGSRGGGKMLVPPTAVRISRADSDS
jgi:hypothetical protein